MLLERLFKLAVWIIGLLVVLILHGEDRSPVVLTIGFCQVHSPECTVFEPNDHKVFLVPLDHSTSTSSTDSFDEL